MQREETVLKTSYTSRCEHSVGHRRDQHTKSPLKLERPRTEVSEWSSCRHWYPVHQGQADLFTKHLDRLRIQSIAKELRVTVVNAGNVAKFIFMTPSRSDMQNGFSLVKRFVDRNAETDSDLSQFMRSRVLCSHG